MCLRTNRSWTLPLSALSLLMALFSAISWCQEVSPGLRARTLFYQEQADDDQLPPVQAVKPRHTNKTESSRRGRVASSARPAVQHLGLRYNLVLINPDTRVATPTRWDANFRAGDCIALDIAADHSGYLYAFDRGSSGGWQALLPSADMPDESNIVNPRTTLRVPHKYCFTIKNPPGDEDLFIVLTRNPEDLYALDESIRTGSSRTGSSPQSHGDVTTTTAENNLDREVERMKTLGLQGRDLEITPIDRSDDAGHPPDSVYVVHTSDTPSDRVVTEIKIKHE